MQSFYSIIYCPIRPNQSEKLSIALYAKDADNIFFKYSKDKLNVVKQLIPESAYKLLKAYLKSIESFFNEKEIKNLDVTLFDGQLNKNFENFLQPEYFSYLNKYSNNLLHFSEATPISVSFSEDVFDILYTKYVFSLDVSHDKKLIFDQKIKKKINPKIKDKVNINIELTSKEISGLVVPTEVWFIGKNGIEVTGEVFDFDKSTYYLENDISKYLNLLHTMNELHKRYGKHFLVGKEPSKTNNPNHSIWDEIRKLSYIEYVDINDVDMISQYVVRQNVLPFF